MLIFIDHFFLHKILCAIPEDFYTIINEVSEDRIKADITTLANFGTRHTLSDTLSQSRGIGAARRWIFNEFQEIAKACERLYRSLLSKNYHEPDGRRIVKPVWINNVVAIQKGTKYPNRFIIMSGDIDSRISDPTNYTDDSPGANDNASGMAGTIEAARVLSKYSLKTAFYTPVLQEKNKVYMAVQDLQNMHKNKAGKLSGL